MEFTDLLRFVILDRFNVWFIPMEIALAKMLRIFNFKKFTDFDCYTRNNMIKSDEMYTGIRLAELSSHTHKDNIAIIIKLIKNLILIL